MPDSLPTNSKIVAAYRERTPASAARAKQAKEVFPSGLVHDSRKLDPYAFYVDHAHPAAVVEFGQCGLPYL